MPLLLPLTLSLLLAGSIARVEEISVENSGRSVGASAVCSIPVAPDPADADTFENQAVPAVIDRIEDDVAVVLLGADEREITCSANALPPEVRAGAAVRLLLNGDQVLHMEADHDEDTVRAARIGAKLEWLRENRMGKP